MKRSLGEEKIPSMNATGYKSEVERSKPPLWSKVIIKPNHYLSGQEGTITQFPTPQTAMVALSNGDRELIKIQDLEWIASEQITESSSDNQKRQIREGTNYKSGNKCRGNECCRHNN